MHRYYESYVAKDLQDKMVFLGGPRQVGKTTVTEHLINTAFPGGILLNWDSRNWRIHPLTLDELPRSISAKEGFQRLMTMGGFPKPFLSNDERKARRWRKERYDRILREDIQDITRVRDVQLIRLLLDALRSCVGGMITFSNLARDLQVSPNTVKEWISLIAEMYIAFPIYPFSKNLPRAIQKPAKLYFYDNADCLGGEGIRLENLVATHLLKRLHFLEDYEGYECSLHYIRDKDGREVDFVTVVDGKVTDLIEVKLSDDTISTSLKYYKSLLNPVRTTQLVSNLKYPYDKEGIQVTTPILFFTEALWANDSE